MQLRIIVPALAAIAAIPTTSQAFEIAGDGWAMAIEPRIQSRVEFSSVSDDAGDDASLYTGNTTEDAQTVNFYFRRLRLYLKGKSDDGWLWNITLRQDGLGSTTAQTGRKEIQWKDAFIGKKFSNGDMTHVVTFGWEDWADYAFISSADSSSKMLFPNYRETGEFGQSNSQTMGFGYTLGAEMFDLTATIAEGSKKADALDDNSDYYFGARIATSLNPEHSVKRTESFLGKEGFGHEVGLSLAINPQGGGSDGNNTFFGVDYLVHYNQISALAEVLFKTIEGTGGADDTDGMAALIQAGYAIPLANGKIFEPAARVALIDNNTDNDDEPGQLEEEGGASGMYVDLGVNYYLDGHSNKFSAAVQLFTPEEGDGDGVVFRLQHQLDF